MIEITKQVRNLASLTGALSELVDAVEKINGIEQYEAEAKARVANIEARAGEIAAKLLEADEVLAKAKDEAAALVSAAGSKVESMLTRAENEAAAKKAQYDDLISEGKHEASMILAEAEDKAAKANLDYADAIAKREAEEEKLAKIQEAIKKITG